MSLLAQLKEAVRPYYLRWIYFRLWPGRRPAAFSSCWRYPFVKVAGDSARLTAAPSPSPLPDLLIYPMTDWHARTQRTQHLVRALAALGYRSIYINPHLGREFDTLAFSDRAHRLSRLEDNIFELHIRLPREPVFHSRLLRPAEEDTIVSALRQVLPVGSKAIQIVSFPLWLGVALRFRRESGFPIVYDCHDLLSGFGNIAREIVAAEAGQFRESDLVLFSSQGLLDMYRSQVPGKCLLVRNAVSARQFGQASALPAAPPFVVGYLGALDSWFDIEAVRQAALINPQCRFVLAGHVEFEPIKRLSNISNVELVGEIPYERVPELLARFRAAMIPFRVNPLTVMTNPIKLYEYFSCGLPVVTSPLPETQVMGELVYTAGTPADFAAQVKRALAEDDPVRRDRRREIAMRESWTARARNLNAEFDAL